MTMSSDAPVSDGGSSPCRDPTMVNLRIISKIKSGDRLQCVNERYFGIERGYLTFLWRWLRVDSRDNTLTRLEETFDLAAALGEPAKSLLEAAKSGVRELVGTYSDDPTTVARLETLLEYGVKRERAF